MATWYFWSQNLTWKAKSVSWNFLPVWMVGDQIQPRFRSSPGTDLIFLSVPLTSLNRPPAPPPTLASVFCKLLMFHLYLDTSASTFCLLTQATVSESERIPFRNPGTHYSLVSTLRRGKVPVADKICCGIMRRISLLLHLRPVRRADLPPEASVGVFVFSRRARRVCASKRINRIAQP